MTSHRAGMASELASVKGCLNFHLEHDGPAVLGVDAHIRQAATRIIIGPFVSSRHALFYDPESPERRNVR